jgi:hypothetical protein
MENALVHRPGDVAALTEHIRLLDRDRALLARLRAASLATAGDLTWRAAGPALRSAYTEALSRCGRKESPAPRALASMAG